MSHELTIIPLRNYRHVPLVPWPELRPPQVIQSIMCDMADWALGISVPTHDEILQRWGREFLMYRRAWDENGLATNFIPKLDRSLDLHVTRDAAIGEFGFPIPSAELLDALARHAPILEVGAGTGYMTALMRHKRIDVIGTDRRKRARAFGFKIGRFDPDQLRLNARLAIQRYPTRTVFCSWPDYSRTWFRQALQVMHVGQRIVTVLEDACADSSAERYLDDCFDRDADIPIPAWYHLNDRAAVWLKTNEKRASNKK